MIRRSVCAGARVPRVRDLVFRRIAGQTGKPGARS